MKAIFKDICKIKSRTFICCISYKHRSLVGVTSVLFFFISSGNTVSGYDFVVNTVWPEVVANIEARTSSIFAPGNPNVFHEVNFGNRYNIAIFVCKIPHEN